MFPAFFKLILTMSYMIYFRVTGLVNIFWLVDAKKPSVNPFVTPRWQL